MLRRVAARLAGWLLFDVLLPTDDFTQTLRKIVISCVLFFAPAAVLVAALCAYQASSSDRPAALWIEVVNLLCIALEAVGYFMVVKKKKTAPDTTTGIYVTAMTAQISLSLSAIPQYDPRLALAGVGILVIMSNCPTPFVAVQVLILVVASAFSIYNDAYWDSGRELLLVPGYLYTNSRPLHALIVSADVFAFTMAAAAVYVQTKSYSAALTRAEENVRMSDEVVGLLRDYDTDGVTTTLSHYEAAQTCDMRLLGGLTEVNHRLQQFRPHLPNYVLRPEEDEDGPALRSFRQTDADSESEVVDLEAPVPTQRRPSSLTTGRRNEGSCRRLTLVHASFLRVHTAEIAPIVDAVYKFAAAFRGSVHHLVGDVAVVSWNATDRVVQHEAKAARFLLRLCRASRTLDCAPVVAGVAFTGDASCFSVLSGSQQTMLIHASWLPGIRGALKLAERARTVLINAGANSIAEYEVVTQAVDCVRYIPSNSRSYRPGFRDARLLLDQPDGALEADQASYASSLLFEVLHEVDRSDNEWMYQLAKSEQQDNVRVTAALRLAVSGCFAEALEQLPLTDAAHSCEDSLQARLRDFCEQRAPHPTAKSCCEPRI